MLRIPLVAHQDGIRLLVWVDNPVNLLNRKFGHLKLPTEHRTWQPKLLLETAEPGPVVAAVLEPAPRHMQMMSDHPLRPYSFRVDLPPGSGNCFKVSGAPKRFPERARDYAAIASALLVAPRVPSDCI